METAGPLCPQHLLHPVQHPGKRLLPVVRPQGAGVQVAEVDTGDQALIQGAQLQHLVQIPQLVDFSHGLRTQGDVPEACSVAGGDDLPQGGSGSLQGLMPAALHQCPGMDHHPLRPHPGGRQAGPGDIADGLFQDLWIRVGQVNKVRRMEGQGDPRLHGVLPHPPGGVLPYMDPLAALIFIAVQPPLRDPAGRGQGGAVDPGKAVAVARRAEPHAHRKGLRFPSRRKGVSAA